MLEQQEAHCFELPARIRKHPSEIRGLHVWDVKVSNMLTQKWVTNTQDENIFLKYKNPNFKLETKQTKLKKITQNLSTTISWHAKR